MCEPGMPADHLREDFVFPDIGVVPIQLTGERQPFVSAEHVSPHARGQLPGTFLALTARELEPTRIWSSIGFVVIRSMQRQLTLFLSSASEFIKSRGRYRKTPMGHSPSSIHSSPAQPDEPRDRGSASTQIPGDPRGTEFHLQRMMDTIRLDELVEQTPEAVAVLNTDDGVLRISKEFSRMFGYEPDEVVG